MTVNRLYINEPGKMKKHRVCTTISAKHWELLKKHTEKFETQQKALEFALESLENCGKQNPPLSREEELWMRAGREMKTVCVLHRDLLKSLLDTADFEKIKEVINNQKPAEYLMIWLYQKPLGKCSLKEVMDGAVFFGKAGNAADTINYTDEGGYYTLKIIHSLNISGSKMLKVFFESLFETYGVKTECEISENSFFMRVYKNS